MSSSSTKRRPSSRVRPAVSFAEKAKVIFIPSHVVMEQQEKDDLWRTKEEIKSTEKDIGRTIRSNNNTDEDYCQRGLECLIGGPAKRKSVQQNKEDVIDAVLDAQEEEWQKGNMHADPEKLRAISSKLSIQAAAKARMLGASDEAYVRRMIRRQLYD